MAAEEMVAIVDAETNRVTGAASRAEMRRLGLPHRATYIFVFDAAGNLYVQHRTMTKDVYPGYWDLCAGGVVLAGESYEESAARELEEEMGIAGVELEPWFDFYFEDQGTRAWGRAFGCRYDGELTLQVEEVQSVERLSPSDVLSGVVNREFTPDSLLALRRRFASSG
jgi:8-oxo-dGTP pyrophosphatase MutT (NUDIX family)